MHHDYAPCVSRPKMAFGHDIGRSELVLREKLTESSCVEAAAVRPAPEASERRKSERKREREREREKEKEK